MHLTPYVVQFHPSNFLQDLLKEKKQVQIKIFFLSQLFYRRAPEFPVTKQSRKSHELIGRDYSIKF
jgi:hypothetical protein